VPRFSQVTTTDFHRLGLRDRFSESRNRGGYTLTMLEDHDLNNIQMTGRLTKNIRSNSVDGTAVVNFTAAIEMGTKPQLVNLNGKEVLAMVPATSYIECAAWGADAIAAATLEAGQEVSFTVSGLTSKGREYQGKVYSDVHARISSVKPGAKAKPQTTSAPAPAAVTTDSIPF
jgi:hypothetical protein